MSKKLPLPEIAKCPCGGPDCKACVVSHAVGKWRVVATCGFAGPPKYPARAAILAWNRRAPDADAERRGAMAAVRYLHAIEQCTAETALLKAIERGEVLPATKKGARKRT